MQLAQLKTMLGDMQGSLDLSLRALPLCRSRDEVRASSLRVTVLFYSRPSLTVLCIVLGTCAPPGHRGAEY